MISRVLRPSDEIGLFVRMERDTQETYCNIFNDDKSWSMDCLLVPLVCLGPLEHQQSHA